MKAERVDNGHEATVREAGARGDSRTLDLYGREFFSDIGRKGDSGSLPCIVTWSANATR